MFLIKAFLINHTGCTTSTVELQLYMYTGLFAVDGAMPLLDADTQ